MRHFAVFIGLIAALLVPIDILAQDFSNIYADPCPITGVTGVGCYNSSNPVPYIANLISGPRGARSVIFGGLLIAMLIFYGIKLLLGSHNESTLGEVKMAYGHALAGSVIVGGAFLFADTFADTTSGNLVDEAPFNTVILNTIVFFKALLATVVVLNVVIQGIRLIVALEDGDIDKARKRLLHGMVGAAFVILASVIVDSFYISRATAPIVAEAFGIARFALTIFGALSVIGLIVSGIMLVVSVDESLKDRAKKLIIICIVALAVVITSYGIINIFI